MNYVKTFEILKGNFDTVSRYNLYREFLFCKNVYIAALDRYY
jgi:hypothetical protein